MLVCIRDIDKNVVRQPDRRIPIGIHGDDAGTAGRHCVLGIMQLGIVCGGDVTVRA